MTSVAHLIDTFLNQLESLKRSGNCAPATRTWYADQLKKLRAVAGDVPIGQLRITHLSEVPLTHHFCRAVKKLFAWAADFDLVAANPFRKLQIPRCGERTRTITPDEFQRLLRNSSAPFRRLLVAAMHTLARPGELRLLKWEHVDLDARVIRLKKFKAKDRRRDGVRMRVIALDDVAVKLIRHRLDRRRPEDVYVFESPKKRPWTPNSLRCAMRRARARAGIEKVDGEHVVCYSIRHTAATKAIRNGLGIKHLSHLLGHSRVTTTERYVHMDVGDLVNAVAIATRN